EALLLKWKWRILLKRPEQQKLDDLAGQVKGWLDTLKAQLQARRAEDSFL
ncbi:unnamed protein product, partial [Urochloa humidicola]